MTSAKRPAKTSTSQKKLTKDTKPETPIAKPASRKRIPKSTEITVSEASGDTDSHSTKRRRSCEDEGGKSAPKPKKSSPKATSRRRKALKSLVEVPMTSTAKALMDEVPALTDAFKRKATTHDTTCLGDIYRVQEQAYALQAGQPTVLEKQFAKEVETLKEFVAVARCRWDQLNQSVKDHETTMAIESDDLIQRLTRTVVEHANQLTETNMEHIESDTLVQDMQQVIRNRD
ncbi:hypothetical protein BG011_007569 [Mortierella polycephala]|uniref:Uncharacterized protein n=1 Tax=Mortierella polycephala TaxID=41804 RepID=A0A9P6QC50_9FUNG|nr:hypothetical protein BG011_007569 [Mortierella polycephala]